MQVYYLNCCPPPCRTSYNSQSRSCDPRTYHSPHHHHHPASPSGLLHLQRASRPETAGRPGRLLLARLDQHAGGRDRRLGQDSPLLLPKEAWTDPGGPCSDGHEDEDCWPSVSPLESLTGSRLPEGGGHGVRGGGGIWPRTAHNNIPAERSLGPPPPAHYRHHGRAAEAASPSSPSDVTTASTASSETYGSKSTGSSSSSRSSNRGRSRP